MLVGTSILSGYPASVERVRLNRGVRWSGQISLAPRETNGFIKGETLIHRDVALSSDRDRPPIEGGKPSGIGSRSGRGGGGGLPEIEWRRRLRRVIGGAPFNRSKREER